jgi:site-specific recombinase XerD
MSLIQRGKKKIWHYDVIIDGQRIRGTTRVKDKKDAEDILAKVRSDVVKQKYYPKPAESPGEKKLFCDMMERFVKEHNYYRRRRISKNTKMSYAYSLKHLLPAFKRITLSKITDELIRQYQRDRENEGSSPASINREIALMSVAFNDAKKWKWITSNPCNDVDRLPEDNERIRYLSSEEVQKLYANLSDWLMPIVTIARHTGLRISNILELSWKDANLFKKVIIVGKTKNGEPLGLPMNQTAFNTLIKLEKVRHINSNLVFPGQDGKKQSRHKVSSAFKSACKRAGIKDFHFHDLRHDFGSNLVQSGISIYSVKELMGHKDVKMTERYSHLSQEKLRKDISVLDAMTQNPPHSNSKKNSNLQTIEKMVGARGFEPPTT